MNKPMTPEEFCNLMYGDGRDIVTDAYRTLHDKWREVQAEVERLRGERDKWKEQFESVLKRSRELLAQRDSESRWAKHYSERLATANALLREAIPELQLDARHSRDGVLRHLCDRIVKHLSEVAK